MATDVTFFFTVVVSSLLLIVTCALFYFTYKQAKLVELQANVTERQVTLMEQEARTVVSSFMIQQIGTEEIRSARREVMQRFSLEGLADGKSFPQIDQKLEEQAKKLAVAYDRLGFLLKGNKTLEKEVLEFHPEVMTTWTMLQRFVKEKWRKELGRENYVNQFERLVREGTSLESRQDRQREVKKP